MEPVVRTIYGAYLQTCKLLEANFQVLPNSTLNQKFNIFPSEMPLANQYPRLRYIAIGNMGSTYDTLSNNQIVVNPIPHQPRHASLYNHIPFIVRPINNDLTATQRANYRLREIRTIGNDTYVIYWLKAIDLSSLQVQTELRNVQNSVVTTTPFTPSPQDLNNPQPPTQTSHNFNDPDGDYLVASARLTFSLNQNEVQEIIDAVNLLFGDPRLAIINEIALVTGIDRQLTVSNTTYTEVVCAQISAFISQFHALTVNTTQVNIELDVGSVEPLFD